MKNKKINLAVVLIVLAVMAGYFLTHNAKEEQSKRLLDQIEVNPNIVKNLDKNKGSDNEAQTNRLLDQIKVNPNIIRNSRKE